MRTHRARAPQAAPAERAAQDRLDVEHHPEPVEDEGAGSAAAGRPSRREKRRGAEAAFEVGRALVALVPAKLEALALPEDILEAVAEARRIHAHAAKKRQLLYLGKLLRQSDVLEDIQEGLARLSNLDRQGTAQFQRLETWRARLLEEGASALEALCQEQPGADRKRLLELMAQTREEARLGRPPAAFRALFRELRDLFAAR